MKNTFEKIFMYMFLCLFTICIVSQVLLAMKKIDGFDKYYGVALKKEIYTYKQKKIKLPQLGESFKVFVNGDEVSRESGYISLKNMDVLEIYKYDQNGYTLIKRATTCF